MYFPHTRTSWDKHMFNGMPNSNFKIGLSLFGCAEKYTEQSTHSFLISNTLCSVNASTGVFSNDLLDQMTY